MCWYCTRECVGDDGIRASFYSGFTDQFTTWKEIVTLYSGRNLTYPGDKLIALRGIANELQKKRPADKYAFGLWQSNLPYELLWSGQAATTDPRLEELHIPSWSWAAHPGGVRFLEDGVRDRQLRGWELSAQLSISFLEYHSLRIVARSKRVDLHAPNMVNHCFRWFRRENEVVNHDNPCVGVYTGEILAICPKEIGPGSVQIALRKERIWVVFDSRDFLSKYQKERDTRKCGKKRKTIGALKRSLGMSAGILEEFSFVEIASDMGWDYAVVGLLLRKSPHTPGRYIRVGLGFAFKAWFEDAKMGTFVLE